MGMYKDAFKAMTHAFGTASQIGLHMVSGIIIGGVAGHYLDKWLGTKPWLFLVFLILGIIAGYMTVYRDSQRLLGLGKKDESEHDREA